MAHQVPPVNATVTKVQASGAGEAFDGPVAPGGIVWQGRADAFATERVLVASGAEGADVNVVTTLAIPSTVPVSSGHYVTYERGLQATTRQVRDLEPHPEHNFTRVFFESA